MSGAIAPTAQAPPPLGDRRGARAGVAYLVGAGPGDPGLMTARALELIATADVILYDRLIPDGALDGARADAELRLRRQEARATRRCRRSGSRR